MDDAAPWVLTSTQMKAGIPDPFGAHAAAVAALPPLREKFLRPQKVRTES